MEKLVKILGNNEYESKLMIKEHELKILNMDSNGIEFVLDQ